MESVRKRLQVFTRVKFDVALFVLSAFGASLIVYLFDRTSLPVWSTVSIAVLWVVLVSLIILLHAEKEMESSEREAGRAEVRELEIGRDEERKENAVNLTIHVIDASTRSLRAITEELREFAHHRKETGEQTETINTEDHIPLKRQMLVHLCRDLRSVFEADPRATYTTGWSHNFFKIALFEPEPAPLNAAQLRRTFFDYPEGVEPSSSTEIVDIEQHKRAGLVLAFIQQNIIVIEDIRTENTKPPEVKRWVNLRENQDEEYESMVCAAIVSGRRGQSDRKCLGVLVIDTNRERYFKEERDYRAFLGTLLNPFRTALTIILELENYLPESGAK